MLISLSVRDLLLIDRLDLELRTGLCALTGETGAGKSILLDALGLCLGERAEATLVRPGAERAEITAEFDVPKRHPVRALLGGQGIDADGSVVLRRIVGRDGRSRALVNEQAVSAGFLRELGDLLVEIQGQADHRGLLDPATHLEFLDGFAGLGAASAAVAETWQIAQVARAELASAEAAAAAVRADEELLRHGLAELEALAPEPGEEAALSDERTVLRAAEKLGSALQGALDQVSGSDAPTARLAAAERTLRRVAGDAAGKLDAALLALERAATEAAEAESAVNDAARALLADPACLERVEERLFALRAAARKHRVPADDLAKVRADFAARLAAIDGGGEHLATLRTAADAAAAAYTKAATALSAARTKGAKQFDKAVNAELGPLRLGKAVFQTAIERAPEPSRGGLDRVWFEGCTNPGHPFGALHKIASGGELGRFLLAIRVVLSKGKDAPVLIFDEVDRGIGGATADAVGERLARLGAKGQVLVITHSPQVAARAASHWRIEKSEKAGVATVRVTALDEPGRREEVARMLAGASVTDEARAAADRLLGANV
ncbi:MAG: DNA repair protein RecN [Alphaproteobacteria bacterium]|nr:DNA repair protein RecN [Alphaproteobacteria bacterium]